ncbi:MAG: hypothetical protein LE168_05905, partial [Endomicrobium sp.]|nr:hypothetical protein [Endomicrobium sp.]
MINIKKGLSMVVTLSLIMSACLSGCGKESENFARRDSAVGAAIQKEQETSKTNTATTEYLQIENTDKSNQLRIYNSYQQDVVPVSFAGTNLKDIQQERNISPLNHSNVLGETSVKSNLKDS